MSASLKLSQQTPASQANAHAVGQSGVSHPSVTPLQAKGKASEEDHLTDDTLPDPFQLKANNTGLPDQLKSGVEHLSGFSLDDVKVHYNSDKPAQLQALAYAQGSDIHLAPGQEQHLPHEAWHVVQQKQGRVQATTQLKTGEPLNDNAGLESEADRMGEQAMRTSFADKAMQLRQVPVAGAILPVQRVVTQILPGEEDGRIKDIVIVGRPDKAFSSTAGDHATAFTAIQVGIENKLRGKTVREASEVMSGLVSDLNALPGMRFVQHLKDYEQERFMEKKSELSYWVEYFRNWRQKNNWRKRMLTGAYPEYTNSLIAPPKIQDDVDDISILPDEINGSLVGALQNYVDAYLELRELVPLSTINTKSISEALAGKGKGETARLLEVFEGDEKIKPDTKLIGSQLNALETTILGLFDARAAALTILYQNGTVAPGVTSESVYWQDVNLTWAFIRQHINTLWSFYPKTMQLISDAKHLAKIEAIMKERIEAKIIETKKLQQEGGPKQKNPRGKNSRLKKYQAASIDVEDNMIVNVRFGGRPKSPFSQTMGAHTTAWIVITDRIWTGLVGLTVEQAAAELLNLGNEARGLLLQFASEMKMDVKQAYAVNVAINSLIQAETPLKKIKQDAENPFFFFQQNTDVSPLSSWQKVLYLQEGITAILELTNLSPGATLYVGRTTGDGEGTHRGVLLKFMDDPQSVSKEEVAMAINGLHDHKRLDQHLSTIGKSLKKMSKEDTEQYQEYLDLFQEYIEEFEDYQDEEIDPQDDQEEILKLLQEHHHEWIGKAYPGALEYAGLKDEEEEMELVTHQMPQNFWADEGVDIPTVISVADFLRDAQYDLGGRQVLVVSGKDWTCYIRCVLYHFNAINKYGEVMALIDKHKINVSNGVQLQTADEDRIRNIIHFVIGQEFYIEATAVTMQAVNLARSATRTGTRVSVLFTGAHFSLLQ
ncbi:eCIS core domain-containing protein [Chitinophaga agri]|uniref:DUF4157 domain-containing protein n=1 Tax=Chitinophaga agri TaxID=2703787 RepID=A0A6B9ZKU3_9BACT|nr:DUF4157 domain-containing protein [Chitinophaga agri]QHS63002.1 DUF4157 domain-containing protein [Chitinophaga agri]